MAQPQPTITTTYAGEFAGEYISAALLSGNTLANGLITVKPNVKYKSVLKTFATDTSSIVDASCDFQDTADISLNEKILSPTEFQQNMILCKDQFQSDWEAVQMGYSAFDNLPPKFSDFLIAHASQQVAQFVENNIWSGTGLTNTFEGLVSLIDNDASVPAGQKITAAAVDAANVIGELGKVVDAIPSPVYGRDDLFIYVSQNVARAYVRALGGFAAGVGSNGTDAKGTQWYNGGALSFDGVKIAVGNGLADNTIVAAQKSNLYFGTGLLSDHNEVRVIDMSQIDGSQQVRVVMRFTAGVQTGIGSDIVLYS